MPRPPSSSPTAVELQILRILWQQGACPVRVIHERLESEKGTNYSTTVKMLAVMLQKRLVSRDESARPHVYRPLLTRARAGRRMVGELIEKVYEGSSLSLVMQALSTSKATKAEIEEVRQLLNRLEEREK